MALLPRLGNLLGDLVTDVLPVMFRHSNSLEPVECDHVELMAGPLSALDLFLHGGGSPARPADSQNQGVSQVWSSAEWPADFWTDVDGFGPYELSRGEIAQYPWLISGVEI